MPSQKRPLWFFCRQNCFDSYRWGISQLACGATRERGNLRNISMNFRSWVTDWARQTFETRTTQYAAPETVKGRKRQACTVHARYYLHDLLRARKRCRNPRRTCRDHSTCWLPTPVVLDYTQQQHQITQIEWVKVLRPTRHRIGYVISSTFFPANLLA